jgi:CDP-diglyceride synthetase
MAVPLTSGWQRVAVLGIIAGLAAVVVIAFALIFNALSDANATAFGHYLDAHTTAIWGFLVAAVPAVTSVAAYLFGSTQGKTTAFRAAHAAASGAESAPHAADAIKRAATAMHVSVGEPSSRR